MATQKTKAQKNRERIKRRRNEMQCELVKMSQLTPKVRHDLYNEPHPKITNSDLTKLDYVYWLLDNGHPLLASQVMEPYSSKQQESYDTHAYELLKRKQEDYGVPRTYR